jgi:hypothetical protein
MKKLATLLVLLIAAAVAPSALADTFTLQTYSVTLYNPANPNAGLGVNWNPVAGHPTFNLSPGAPVTFSLFNLYTTETTVNPDDTTPKQITVSFTFDPPGTTGVVTGSTDGFNLFGVLQGGIVIWNGPVTVNFGKGGSYTFSLSNGIFNVGLFGTDPGSVYGANIRATLTENSSGAGAPVPEPGSLALMGTGLIGAAGLLRRRFSS